MKLIGVVPTAAVCVLTMLCAACAPAWVPVIGKNPDMQVSAVRSIKQVRVRRIAVMPPIEAPTPGDSVASGASDTLTAELQAKMALEAGWQMVAESDIADAMQKLPPPTEANVKQVADELGKKVAADGVLYGRIEEYKERVGSDYAAASPASVAFTLHLLDIKSGQDIWSARFEKSQKALTENVFNLASFIQNSGRWVMAHEIAAEGVDQAVDSLHKKVNLQPEGPSFEIPRYQGKFDQQMSQ
jgi:hypothetical protein